MGGNCGNDWNSWIIEVGVTVSWTHMSSTRWWTHDGVCVKVNNLAPNWALYATVLTDSKTRLQLWRIQHPVQRHFPLNLSKYVGHRGNNCVNWFRSSAMILCYTCNHYDVCFLTATRMVGALGVQFCKKEREMSHKTVEIIRIFAQFLRMARKKKTM